MTLIHLIRRRSAIIADISSFYLRRQSRSTTNSTFKASFSVSAYCLSKQPISVTSRTMSDDELDPELIAAFRQSQLAARLGTIRDPEDTGVLDSAKFICDNSIDVALDMQGTKSAAEIIYAQMKAREYSPKTWSEHELHPKSKDESTVNFIFTLDLLNFSFWSEKSKDEMYAVEYQGKKWTGYWSLVAALRRALDEGIRITDPNFWHDEEECTEEVYKHVFRSATEEEMPLLKERILVLQEAAEVLCKVRNTVASFCMG